MTTTTKDLSLLLKQAQEALPAGTPTSVKKLQQTAISKILPDDIEFFDAHILNQMALLHWEMVKNHKKGKSQFRSYCSQIEEGQCRNTIIDIVAEDQAFLVDSVVAEINRQNLLISILVPFYVYVKYDEKGKVKDIKETPEKNYIRHAHIHLQINSKFSNETAQTLEKELQNILNDVCHANADWEKMLSRMKEANKTLEEARTNRSNKEIQEYCAFLDYLSNNNFTLLGYREYKFIEKENGVESHTIKGSSLGLLRDDIKPAYINENEEALPRNLQELRRSLPPISVSKSNRMSTVHRLAPLDCIAVKLYDDKGKIVGEKLFIGLFTSVTYSRSVSDVPYLRQKVADVMALSGYISGSHDARALRHVLEKYPRDELFQIDAPELLEIAKNIVRLQERQRIALFMRKDPFGRYVSCLVYIPRDRFSTKLREDIGNILEEETHGKCTNFYTNMDNSVFARVMFSINVNKKERPALRTSRIEKRLREAGETWKERLTQALIDTKHNENDIIALNQRYSTAFSEGYNLTYKARQCVYDIEKIEKAYKSKRVVLDLYRPKTLNPQSVRLKIFHLDTPIALSDVMPILENLGVRVIAEMPFEVKPADKECSLWIHDFLLETPEGKDSIHITKVKKNIERAIEKAWYKEVEDDALNNLILAAGTNWHEITILRAYVRYIKQLGVPFSLSYIAKALTTHPKTAHVLIDLFKAHHDPSHGDKSEKLVKKARKAMDKELSKVTSGDFDRILRSIMHVIEATVRTNYYLRDKDGSAKQYLSLKFDSSQIPFMPKPVPFREIFVYSPKVDAVHLRGGKIARGGMRWSDRHEDFRTEVLGLMKAQMVKNSVIVPMGSKGGFVVKTPTNSREEFMAEGIECYKIFIRGMLDITDNQKGKKIIPPKGIVRRDEDDPYLVVAADKGTASFSDIANGLAQEYGFWLDDAFASGGSAGYDHKEMGITAKGAWESVKYHFRLMGRDIQKEGFSIIGVGDMGGDVFGNGMILSKHTHLLGAFNHLHIFCDPNPDPVSTFKERTRLFKALAGWDQYNTSLLSKGGRIYNRSDKTLKLTKQIKERFNISKDEVTPEDLMNAMLKTNVDLLWFGGIGTYIKASTETNAQAGDKANDTLRVNAKDIQAKVIGEGANLALTALSRVELAKHGIALNTDFIDNSAGVDSSDHEVNIKILLSDVMTQKKHNMDLKTRNKLLVSMTDEVADHVLKHNYHQAQAISMLEMQATVRLPDHEAYIQHMEQKQGFSRALEGMPTRGEVETRLRERKGLTRPELSVLLAYAKNNLTKTLLASSIPDNPKMNYWIIDYFPKALKSTYEKEILRHRLKREIISTMIAGSLIDRLGPTFLQSVMNKTSFSINEVMQAYLIARDTFGLRHLWAAVDAIDGKVSAQVQLQLMGEISTLAEHGITWFLTRLGRDMNIDTDVTEFRDGIKELVGNLNNLVTENLGTLIKERTDLYVKEGVPEDVAEQIAYVPALSSACDILRMAEEHHISLQDTARTYYDVGERFHVYWMRQQVRTLPRENQWQTEATDGLLEQLYGAQAGITRRILRDVGSKTKDGKLTDEWIKSHSAYYEQVSTLYADLCRTGSIDLTMFTVAQQRLHALYRG